MKYILIPIFKFIYFVIGGTIWSIGLVIKYFWTLKKVNLADDHYFGNTIYQKKYTTPWDYLTDKKKRWNL